MRRPPHCEIEAGSRRVLAVLADRTVACEVPALFGEILSAEVRGDFIVVHAARGKASFHATSKLAGRMPWHALRKAYRELCLAGALVGRVDFHLTHHRYRSGGESSVGAAARILVDGRIVCRGLASPGPGEFSPRALGAALASYLDLAPSAALVSDDPLVQALALLDRRLGDDAILALEEPPAAHPLWRTFHRLRRSVAAPS
jgi:hypothetical protein